MKRKPLLFLFIVLSAAQITNAQIKKGTIFLGGQVGFSTGKSESDVNTNKQTSYSISPAVGIFTKDNLVWGGDVYFTGSETNAGGGFDPQKNSSIGLGAFVRQYFTIVDRFYLFGQANLGFYYNWNDWNNGITAYNQKGYGVNLSIYPGVSFALKKNIHLETGFNNLASIGYNHTKRTDDTQTTHTVSKTNSFGFGANLNNAVQINIGLRFMLQRSAG